MRDSGVSNLIRNFFRSVKKYRYLFSETANINLEFMEPKLSFSYIPDIDAIYLSNPLDIVKILKLYGVDVIRYSSFELPTSFILDWISKVPFVKYLASTFIIVGLKRQVYYCSVGSFCLISFTIGFLIFSLLIKYHL